MNHEYLMQGLSVQHLRFTVLAQESIAFDEQPGSALRGALYQALADNFCSEMNGPVTPDHVSRCPVCWLLAAENPKDQRGHDMPRPLTVEPPLNCHLFQRDQVFTFGFSLIGKAQDLLPYLARAVEKMGRIGVGKGRGRFRLISIAEVNPLLDVERTLLQGNLVKKPTLQVTPGRISESAAQLDPRRLTLEFLTPLRLTADSQLVKSPDPTILIQRLMERVQRMATDYAEIEMSPSREEWLPSIAELLSTAASLKTAYNDTRWVEVWSGSARQHCYTPIGGLVGTVRWEGDVSALLPWVLWGASLHVGKNAVKGNGWYRVVQK